MKHKTGFGWSPLKHSVASTLTPWSAKSHLTGSKCVSHPGLRASFMWSTSSGGKLSQEIACIPASQLPQGFKLETQNGGSFPQRCSTKKWARWKNRMKTQTLRRGTAGTHLGISPLFSRVFCQKTKSKLCTTIPSTAFFCSELKTSY